MNYNPSLCHNFCMYIVDNFLPTLVLLQNGGIDNNLNFTIEWNSSITGGLGHQYIMVVNIYTVTSSTPEWQTLREPSAYFSLQNNTEYSINISLCNEASNFHFGMCCKYFIL